MNSYGGYSKKGYAPYNPKKKNQDALIMAEDPKTRSLLFCVMDGHGEDGDKVSQNIKSKFANYLFKHRDFATDIQAALTDVIARCETEVLRGEKYVYRLPLERNHHLMLTHHLLFVLQTPPLRLISPARRLPALSSATTTAHFATLVTREPALPTATRPAVSLLLTLLLTTSPTCPLRR